jgi:amidase
MDRISRYTMPFNVSGSPTLSLPCGFDRNGMPLGLQLVGPYLSEALLCRAGHAFQQATRLPHRASGFGAVSRVIAEAEGLRARN